MSTAYSHLPVMPEETLAGLAVREDGVYLDGTAGLGGHAALVAPRCRRLIALDKDADALEMCRERLAPFGEKVTLVRSDFRRLEEALDRLGIGGVNGVLFDLGVSSMQLDDPERGFSYRHDAPLDMRMDRRGGMSAREVINDWPADRLRRVLYEYGEERYAAAIAAAIVRARPVQTTGELAAVVAGAMPGKGRREAQHPARRTFQAVRIAVNDELGAVEEGLAAAVNRLCPGGRLCVITFHSLEDRAVKRFFARQSGGCTCPPDFPACVCGGKARLKTVGRYEPTPEEIKGNPRAASARLRVAEKVQENPI